MWAFLLSFASYPVPFGFLAWFAVARPLAIISRLSSREAFSAGYYFGFFFNLFSLWWVGQVTPPGMITAVAIVAVYYALVLWLFNRLFQFKPWLGLVGVPLLWVGMEYFRTLTQFAFPWSDLGYSQSYYLWVIQIAALISTHGLSLLIVVVNVLIWQVFRSTLSPERRVTSGLAVLGIIAAVLAYGWIELPRFPVPGHFKLAVLQGAIPIEEKWKDENEAVSLNRYDSLARTVADDSVRLYLWPETAAPCYVTHEAGCRDHLGEIARRTGAYHLVGALAAGWKDGRQRYFNSCFQFNPQGGIDDRYDKIKLVPFTEQVPYQEHLPFLRREFLMKYLTFIKTYNIRWWSDFYPGDSIHLFHVDDVDYGALICFESAFPEFVRDMILRGAHFVVNITNDTWFEGTPGVQAHARILIMRAVENRCWMVQAANSGYSYIVDGYGRVRKDLPVGPPGAMVGAVRLLDEYSFFTRHGDIAGCVSFLISWLLAIILLLRWIVRKRLRH